jgi:hypothetical protein
MVPLLLSNAYSFVAGGVSVLATLSLLQDAKLIEIKELKGVADSDGLIWKAIFLGVAVGLLWPVTMQSTPTKIDTL